jgi:large subunit ribosomal protein L35
MPKMKSVKGAVKRFKKTKGGIKRGTAYRSHILTKQDAATRRKQHTPKYVNANQVKIVQEMMV